MLHEEPQLAQNYRNLQNKNCLSLFLKIVRLMWPQKDDTCDCHISIKDYIKQKRILNITCDLPPPGSCRVFLLEEKAGSNFFYATSQQTFTY